MIDEPDISRHYLGVCLGALLAKADRRESTISFVFVGVTNADFVDNKSCKINPNHMRHCSLDAYFSSILIHSGALKLITGRRLRVAEPKWAWFPNTTRCLRQTGLLKNCVEFFGEPISAHSDVLVESNCVSYMTRNIINFSKDSRFKWAVTDFLDIHDLTISINRSLAGKRPLPFYNPARSKPVIFTKSDDGDYIVDENLGDDKMTSARE